MRYRITDKYGHEWETNDRKGCESAARGRCTVFDYLVNADITEILR